MVKCTPHAHNHTARHLVCRAIVRVSVGVVQISGKPLPRDKWLIEAAKERLFILLRQHIESGHTGELLEQVLLTIATLPFRSGVYGKAIEVCSFIISR